MIYLKVVPLISNFKEKIVFRKIRLIFGSKIGFELQQCPTFVSTLQNLSDSLETKLLEQLDQCSK